MRLPGGAYRLYQGETERTVLLRVLCIPVSGEGGSSSGSVWKLPLLNFTIEFNFSKENTSAKESFQSPAIYKDQGGALKLFKINVK